MRSLQEQAIIQYDGLTRCPHCFKLVNMHLKAELERFVSEEDDKEFQRKKYPKNYVHPYPMSEE